MPTGKAGAIVERLGLALHLEGGWYKETWRAPAEGGERGAATAILFLLDHGERSHWHRVDAAEMWLWHAGAALALCTAPDDRGPVAIVRLGPDIVAGETPQHLIPSHYWQAAEAAKGWALVSCIVSPAFEFADFELAVEGWAPGSAA